MPMMPFIGVRISWLTVARKRDLAWLANSARSRALISAVSARLRGVMSRAMARCETSLLALSRTDSSIQENQRVPPLRADRDVGRAQAFAVGEGRVRNDADIDAELGQRAADQIALVHADQFGEDPVGVDDAALAVAMHDEVAERVDQAAKALLALLQLPHPVGEVLDLGAAARATASTGSRRFACRPGSRG